jgi:hypothetical protein
MSDEPKHTIPIQTPPFRRLRTYAFDPSLGVQVGTLGLNETVLRVPWEADPGAGAEAFVGPVGEYLEVVDYDPANRCFYAPVDLNHPLLLAQDGLAPSEGNPQFHQQMVYAVAMTTIHHFERALGRLALWAPRLVRDENNKVIRADYVRRLRVYPHALREANAYYSPEKKALLFGYFPASRAAPGQNLPGGVVFTCLSHDVVAHETTHALLDGMQRYFIEPSNPDVTAFHEAFADIVAMFQHFAQPEALRDQIARTRGDLAQQNILGELAQQFGQAIGNHGALRSAIGHRPDPADYATTTEPHARGAILVAAIFEAFLAVYRARIADLVRIATGGTGRLAEGEIHPDLVRRLAHEAARTATRFLQNGIRALDYCPPVDITFGDYLRAMVTADLDFGPDDSMVVSVALVEAFRARGIYPRDVRTLSIDALLWPVPDGIEGILDVDDFIKAIYLGRIADVRDDDDGGAATSENGGLDDQFVTWAVMHDRKKAYKRMRADAILVHDWIARNAERLGYGRVLGLELGGKDLHRTITNRDGTPRFEVHSVRSARRQDADGRPATDLIIQITQKRRGYQEREAQRKADRGEDAGPPDFKFRGGCTLVIDLPKARVRRCIVKDILSDIRLDYQRQYRVDSSDQSLWATYFGDYRTQEPAEPFAMLHRYPAGGQP